MHCYRITYHLQHPQPELCREQTAIIEADTLEDAETEIRECFPNYEITTISFKELY